MKKVCYINAGAGAGKTYRLTSDLMEFFTKEHIRPSEVILTTYTELAAGEIREKSRQAILAAEDIEYEHRIQLAVELESAAIGTVHSIAFDFIKRYWYLLDYGADIEVMPTENERIYLNQSLTDMLTPEDYAILTDYQQWLGGKEDDEELKSWQEHLVKLIEEMNYYHVENLTNSLELSIQTLHKLFSGKPWTDTAVKTFQELLHRYLDYCLAQKTTKTNTERIHTLKACTDFEHNYGQYKKLRTLMMAKPAGFTKAFSKDEQATWMDFDNYCNSVSYLAPLEQYVTCLFDIAKRWNQTYADYKKQHHIITFNDMELIFLQLLEEQPEVREEIAQRYRVLMVDEFQDSNPVQLKIFNLISEIIGNKGGRSIWVGDPKQAIYGFRGADAELVQSIGRHFDHARQEDELSTDVLRESWRSSAPLVDLVNHVFLKVFANEIPHREHIELKAHFSEDFPPVPLRHWQFLSEDKRGKKFLYPGIAAQVERLLGSGLRVSAKGRDKPLRPVTFRDIAILARSNDEVAALAAALRHQGIPVSATETNILQRMEVRLVMTVLEYFIEPYQPHFRADFAVFFSSATVSELLTDRLHYLAEKPEGETDNWKSDAPFMSALERLRKQVERRSISEMVSAIVYQLNLPALVGKWGEQSTRQQNLYTLIEMAHQYDESCVQMGIGSTIAGYLNYLRTTDPEAVVDNVSNTVKVVTYHRSKGLEWPVVILTSLDKGIKDPNNLIKSNYMGIHEEGLDKEADSLFNRYYLIHFLPQFYSGKSSVPQVLQDKILAFPDFQHIAHKTISESKRLLYVGMTRARDYLISVGYKEQPLQWLVDLGIQSEVPAPGCTEANIWGEADHLCQVEFVDTSLLKDKNESQRETYDEVEWTEEHTDYPLKFQSPSKLEADGADEEVALQIVPHIGTGIPHNKWKDMAAVGTCIHNIFAIYQNEDEANLERALRVIGHFELTDVLGTVAPAIIEAATALYEYLTRTYGPATHIDHELPFYHKVGAQIVHGEMDLVWNYEDHGTPSCVLIDFKTFPGKFSDLESKTRQYVPQLRAYRSALQTAGREVSDNLIYYAAQGAIAKVKL